MELFEAGLDDHQCARKTQQRGCPATKAHPLTQENCSEDGRPKRRGKSQRGLSASGIKGTA